MIVEGGHVGCNELEKEMVEIFPNPAGSVISLQSTVFSLQMVNVEIYDVNGIYFCKITAANASIPKKLIIQK